MVAFSINGKEVRGRETCTVLEVARSYGIKIPTLCFQPLTESYNACRLCLVEVDDGRKSKLVISGLYPVQAGLKVSTDTSRVKKVRRWFAQERRLSISG